MKMSTEKEMLELIMDLSQLKLNLLSMMVDFIQEKGNSLSEDDKEDLLLLYLFINEKKPTI